LQQLEKAVTKFAFYCNWLYCISGRSTTSNNDINQLKYSLTSTVRQHINLSSQCLSSVTKAVWERPSAVMDDWTELARNKATQSAATALSRLKVSFTFCC